MKTCYFFVFFQFTCLPFSVFFVLISSFITVSPQRDDTGQLTGKYEYNDEIIGGHNIDDIFGDFGNFCDQPEGEKNTKSGETDEELHVSDRYRRIR